MARKLIDLTFTIHEGMTTYPRPWHPVVEISQLGRHGIEGRETRKLVLGTHTGTHMDAPRHFIPDGKTVDEIPLETLVGPARIIDFSRCETNQQLEIDDFKKQLGDTFPERIVMMFDWCKHYSSMKYYTDHGYISEECAHWMVENGLKMLAMDTAQPDNPRPDYENKVDSPIHKILLGNDVILVEYLSNLKKINNTEIALVVLPLKLESGDGSPVRCMAIEEL